MNDYDAMIKEYKDAESMKIGYFPHYLEGYVFDENKSVKWNREQVSIHNEKRDQQVKELREAKGKALKEAKQKIINYLIEEYPKVNKKVVEKLFNKFHNEIDWGIEAVIEECEDILYIIAEEDNE